MNEYSYLERHMGTDVSLSFVCKEVIMADTIAAETFITIREYEQRFSRFLPNSELSRLNTYGTLVVSSEFIQVLKKSIELNLLTAGAFNPLLQVRALGYTKNYNDLAGISTEISFTTYNTDVHKIAIDSSTNTVTLDKKQQLDFGGVLKGYLANKLADEIVAMYPECQGLIINIGGDLVTRGCDALHAPFIFELYNPVTGEEIQIPLTNMSLATSGTYARYWQADTGRLHHIVNPDNLQNPDNNQVAVSIIHHDGAVAEALAKLFLVRGIAEATTLLVPEKFHYQYFVVSNTGKVSTNIL